MEFKILGPLEVDDGGRALDLGGHKQRAVLAILVLHANRVVPLERIIDDLWGDEAPARATGTLQAYVSNLRRLLEPDRPPRAPATVLASVPPGYALRIPAGDIDAVRFESLATAGHAALEAGEAAVAAARLDEALALWRGEALVDFGDEPFAQSEIARLAELRASAREARAAADIALGRHAVAVAELERLVVAAPLRERLRELLMLALYRSGRQAEALRAFQDARAVLVDELGIEPSPALVALEEQILRQDPALDAPSSSDGGAASPPAPTPTPASAPIDARPSPDARPAMAPTAELRPGLVGRDAQIERLDGVLRAGQAGEGRIVLVGGEPGIGKTAVASEAAERAAAAGYAVAWGRSHEDEGAPAFWPWVQVLRALAAEGLLDVPGVGRTPDLTQLLPELAPVAAPGSAGERLSDPDAARFQLYDAVTRLLLQTAERRPVLVVLDDLQWADRSTLRLLEFVAGSVRTSALVVVTTFRESEIEPGGRLVDTLAALARAGVTERLPLEALTGTDVGRYIETVTGAEVAPSLADDVQRRTAGNPFFVAELVRLLTSEGHLARGALPDGPLVPSGVRDVIRRRVARLPETGQTVLSAAAVAGTQFTLDLLAAACRLDEDATLDLIETALLTGLLVEADGPPGTYRFAHPLVRETLYQDLSGVRRARLHARIAAALEELHAEHVSSRVAELAHHWMRAAAVGHADKALAFAREAARQADAQRAYEEAVARWEDALAAFDVRPGPPIERCDLLIALGRARRRAGDGEGARLVLEQAADLAEQLQDGRRLAMAAVDTEGWLVWLWRSVGEAEAAVALLRRALAALGDDDVELRVQVLANLAVEHRYALDAAASQDCSAEALALARSSGAVHVVAHALVARGIATWSPQSLDEHLAVVDELIALGDAVPAELVLLGRLFRSVALLASGRRDDSDAELAVVEERADALRVPGVRVLVAWNWATRLTLDGRFADAEAASAAALKLHEDTATPGAFDMYGAQLFNLRWMQGRLDELLDFFLSLVGTTQIGVFREAAVLIFAVCGRLDEARAALTDAHILDRAGRDSIAWFIRSSALAEALAELGEPAFAAHLYDELLPLASKVAIGGMGIVCDGSGAHFLGRLAATIGRWDDAERHFLDAIERNGALRAPGLVAWSEAGLGQVLLARRGPGDAEAAAVHLASARATAERLDMAALAERVSALMEAAAT